MKTLSFYIIRVILRKLSSIENASFILKTAVDLLFLSGAFRNFYLSEIFQSLKLSVFGKIFDIFDFLQSILSSFYQSLQIFPKTPTGI